MTKNAVTVANLLAKMTDSQIDDAVVDGIREGCDRLALLVRRFGLGQKADDERSVDRALQRLRKAGRIELVGKPRRWRIK